MSPSSVDVEPRGAGDTGQQRLVPALAQHLEEPRRCVGHRCRALRVGDLACRTKAGSGPGTWSSSGRGEPSGPCERSERNEAPPGGSPARNDDRRAPDGEGGRRAPRRKEAHMAERLPLELVVMEFPEPDVPEAVDIALSRLTFLGDLRVLEARRRRQGRRRRLGPRRRSITWSRRAARRRRRTYRRSSSSPPSSNASAGCSIPGRGRAGARAGTHLDQRTGRGLPEGPGRGAPVRLVGRLAKRRFTCRS